MSGKTVGMLSSYPRLNQGDWLWKQTPHPMGKWKNISIQATASNPDYLLLYQYDFVQPKKNSLGWKSWFNKSSQPQIELPKIFERVPKERIIYLLREPPLQEVLATNINNYSLASECCGYVSGPDDYAPQPYYMPADWHISNTFRDLADLPAPEKVNLCSWITSGTTRTENHRKRLSFMEMLKNNQIPCDFYGRGLPSWTGSRGEVQNKWNVLAPYYYNLAIENYADSRWYISEKLWDSLLGWCLPIYYGGSDAEKLLPPKSFLRLPSLDQKGVDYIQEVTSSLDAWYEAKDAIAEARQIILYELNLLNWLSEFVEK
jgi:hypothetical protein